MGQWFLRWNSARLGNIPKLGAILAELNIYNHQPGVVFRAVGWSFVVQLTDPSEYQGGRLELMFGLGDDAATEKGWMTVFPSYRPHHVTPVTEGVRHAIVGWVHGPSFR